MFNSPDLLLFNLFLSVVAGFVCATIPFLFGYGFDKRTVGDARARFVFVFVALFGSLFGFLPAAYLGVFAAIVFALEIVFLNKKEHLNVPQ